MKGGSKFESAGIVHWHVSLITEALLTVSLKIENEG